MALQIVDCPDLVITAAGTTSNGIRLFDDAVSLAIYPPATFTSTSIVVEVSPSSTGVDFTPLMSGDTIVQVFPDSVRVLNYVPFRQLRLEAPGAEVADATFKVTRQILV